MGPLADDTQPSNRKVSPFLLLWLAIAQIVLLTALAWLWSTGSSDATATTVDWAFLGLTLATPSTLVLSSWIGWRVGMRVDPRGPAAVRVAARITQWVTLGMTALSLVLAPPGVFGAVFPMG